jgi:glutamate synthase (ferredoxin)
MTGGRVAVLGPVGDNFAAGMSGGIAWVLDEDGQLESRLNTGHVKLYDVSAGQADELNRLLEMHAKATGSQKAREILEHFSDWLQKFKAVISDEYLNWMKGA